MTTNKIIKIGSRTYKKTGQEEKQFCPHCYDDTYHEWLQSTEGLAEFWLCQSCEIPVHGDH